MDRAAVKTQARQLNQGNTFSLFVVLFVIGLLSGGISIVTSISNVINRIMGPVLFETASVIDIVWDIFSFPLMLILIPVFIAMQGYFVNFVRTRRAAAGDGISYSFKNGFNHFGRYFEAAFTTGFLIGIWFLLPFVGWVVGITRVYRYYFVAQIIHDNPQLTSSQARAISKNMTDGLKGELFMMELSFIGWAFLSIFTFGILLIYVRPYMETTKALYYENMRIRAIQAGLVHPQQFSAYPAAQTDRYGNPIPPVSGVYGQPPVNGGFAQAPYGQPPVNPIPQQQPVTNPAPQQPYTAPLPQVEIPIANPVEVPLQSPAPAPQQEEAQAQKNTINTESTPEQL